ncbi:YpzG family protein [Cytobacillus dafuensis]|uniref:YpzG family protein n=1 Tax=Cytobacillus dafuensis TaxID=1742359 RepID=A0A5B8Z1Q8_CYTDA|nr:YpzG family protein [Cytobacillus dafuensis]QED46950.1 YpzG family protein [Cytobacillus dafuensis]
MAKPKNFFNSKVKAPWYRPKRSHSQVNGETQLTQDLIILEATTRRRS